MVGMPGQRRPFGLKPWLFWVIAVAATLLIGAIPVVGPYIATVVIIGAIVIWFVTPKPAGVVIPAAPESAFVALNDDGDVDVVGWSAYQEPLRYLARQVHEDDEVTFALVPEPQNPHDANAVRVDALHESATFTVGYLPARIAGAYQPGLLNLARQGKVGTADGSLDVEDGQEIRVYLRLSEADEAFD